MMLLLGILNFMLFHTLTFFYQTVEKETKGSLVTHESKYHVPYPCTKFANICCMNEKRMLPYQYMTTECGIA